MLNRKVSNYLFYGILVIIVGAVLITRSITIGNINEKITQLENANIVLQAMNDDLEKDVEAYKDFQMNHLYELYSEVPNHYSQTELTYYTIAQLETVGVDESVDFQRSVFVNSEVTFSEGSPFFPLQEDFKIVEVQIYFTTLNTDVVEELMDLLHNSAQVFIVNTVEYTAPDGVNYIGVTINFLAFYEVEEVLNTEDAS